MSRTTFLGRESLGPDEQSPKVPADSPRHHSNRNGAEERRSDELLDKLSPRLVRDGAGHTVTLPRDQPLKKGWTVVGPAPAEAVTHKIVCDPNGQHVRHAVSQPLKAGWRHVAYVPPPGAPADIDTPVVVAYPDGSETTTTAREHLARQLDAEAHEIRPMPYRTGRRLNLIAEGEGTPMEVADDSDIAVPHGARNDPFTKGGK